MSDLAIIPGELPTFTGESLEAHLDAWNKAVGVREFGNWAMGSIASSLKGRYGSSDIQNFATQANVSQRHLYDLARTFEVWKPLGINPRLSFTHHRIAAKAEDPKLALETAEHEQLSTRQLEQFIKTGELPGLPAFEPEIEEPEPTEAEKSKAYPHGSLGAWYDFVAQQPCYRSGEYGVQVAHYEGLPSPLYAGWMPRRKGLSNWLVIPLTPYWHMDGPESIHKVGERAFFDSYRGRDHAIGYSFRLYLEFSTQ